MGLFLSNVKIALKFSASDFFSKIIQTFKDSANKHNYLCLIYNGGAVTFEGATIKKTTFNRTA